MIEGLKNILESSGEPGLAELRGLLRKLFVKRGHALVQECAAATAAFLTVVRQIESKEELDTK